MPLPENARTWTGAHDRTDYPAGPWDTEPDKVSWTDPATGRPCLIVRGPLGALCGYVAVDPGHPLHGVGYGEARRADGDWIAVHGGLTYSDRCMETEDEGAGICHVPEPGAPDDVWWFGFDCSHSMDLVPRMLASAIRARLGTGVYRDDVYRTLDYVVGEVESLAKQLVAAGEA
jgi:hypothetical protein